MGICKKNLESNDKTLKKDLEILVCTA